MSLIRNISIGISADTREFTRGTLAAADALNVMNDAKARSNGLDATGGLRGSGAGGARGNEADGAASAAAMGSQMRAAMTAALQPLNTFGATLSRQFNAVGGTITTLARRIDAAIKFPATKRALDELQTSLRSRIASASGVATDSLTRLQRATLALGPAADRAISGFRAFNNVKTIFSALTSYGDVARRPLERLAAVKFDATTASAGKLGGQFRTMAPAINTVSTSVKGLGVQVGLALGVFGLAFKATQGLVGFFAGGVKGAMDLGETLSKTREVFGDATEAVISQADTMAKAFGLPRTAMLDAASSIGLIAEGAGRSKGQAAEMANAMAKLAADASSFYNVPLETSLEKIRSGLVGEAEPLRQFGVLLSEAAVKAEAHRLGLDKGSKTLDEQTKVVARASLITKGLATASGDLARTQDSASNQFRKSGGGLQNFATTVGGILIPAVQSGIGVFNELLASVIDVFEANRPMIEGWAEQVKSAVDFAGSVVRNFGDYWEIAKLSAVQQISNIIAYVEVIPGNLRILATYIAGNWREMISDGIQAVGRLFQNLGKNIGELVFAVFNFFADPMAGFKFEWTPLLEGFQATAAALPELLKPELVNMQGEIEDVMGRIQGRDAARVVAKGPAVAKPKLPGEKDEKEGQEKSKDNAALELGSKEAGSAIAKFRNQGGEDDKPIKDVAKSTEELVKLKKESMAYMKKAKDSGNSVALAIAKL